MLSAFESIHKTVWFSINIMSRSLVIFRYKVLLTNVSIVLTKADIPLPISFIIYLVGHIVLQNTLPGKSLSSFSIAQSSKYYFSHSYLHIVIEMAKMWGAVLVLESGVKTKLYWHWVPLVRQTLTTGENPKP